MRRSARDGEKARTVGERRAFQHSSGHDDLKALVAEHLLGETAAEETSGWRPSRRGNSPRGPARGSID
jgi:hypothetical protein